LSLRSDWQISGRVAKSIPIKGTEYSNVPVQSSVRSIENTDMSTIQYFWSTARTTSVFKKITQNHRNVLSLLREAAPETNQLGQAPLSKAEIALWRTSGGSYSFSWSCTPLYSSLWMMMISSHWTSHRRSAQPLLLQQAVVEKGRASFGGCGADDYISEEPGVHFVLACG